MDIMFDIKRKANIIYTIRKMAYIVLKGEKCMSNEIENIQVEELHKEIDLIQGCINRMANNSFLLKGWLVSIIAVVVTLSLDEMNKFVITLMGIMITISFWYLDSYFLRMEKLYRKMYEWVLENRKQGNRDFQYDLNPHRFDTQVERVSNIMYSKTMRWFYGIIILLIVMISVYYSWDNIVKLICKC